MAGRRQCRRQRHGALRGGPTGLGATAVDHGVVGGVRDDADHVDALPAAPPAVSFIFREGTNPYEGKKNVLTERQVKAKRRLMKHVKGK